MNMQKVKTTVVCVMMCAALLCAAACSPLKAKSAPKTLVYIEVNDSNPLNALSYTFKKSGRQFFDYVVIFSATLNYSAEKGVYLGYIHNNENIKHIFENREKYIKPLQDKGIKVLMGLLGDHDGVSFGTLDAEDAKKFAALCKETVDAYGLDGVDFDDEWANSERDHIFVYPDGYYWDAERNEGVEYNNYKDDPEGALAAWKAGGEKMARCIVEMRRAMPNKTITLFEYNFGRYLPETVDGVNVASQIDWAMYAIYGKYRADSFNGIPHAKYAPMAISFKDWNDERFEMPRRVADNGNLDNDISYISNLLYNYVGGYGFLFFYNLNDVDKSDFISMASRIIYNDDVVHSGAAYPKDW